MEAPGTRKLQLILVYLCLQQSWSFLPQKMSSPPFYVGGNQRSHLVGDLPTESPLGIRTQRKEKQTLTLSMSISPESRSPAVAIQEDSSEFEPGRWQAFSESMKEVTNSPRVLKKCKPESLKESIEFLNLNKREPLPPGLRLSHGKISQEEFRQAALEQRAKFREKRGNMQTKEYEFMTRCLIYVGDYCAKRNNPLPVATAWQKIREAGVLPHENCISTFMYVLATDESLKDVLMEAATYHSIMFKPNEKISLLRIKTHIADGDVGAAEDILNSIPDGDGGDRQCKRLRTCMPLMEYYLSVGDLNSVVELYHQMQSSDGVHVDSEAYSIIISGLAEKGVFSVSANPIERAVTLGFPHSSGPELFDMIASDMSRDFMEISEDAAVRITNSLRKAFDRSSTIEGGNATEYLESSEIGTPDYLIAGRVLVDDTSALCPVSGAKLRLFALDETQRAHVRDTLLAMARNQRKDFLKARSQQPERDADDEVEDLEYGFYALTSFSEWLDSREENPFTVIIDGPNVAYFKDGFIRYSKLKLFVDKFEAMGEYPLITMPSKYTEKKFRLATGRIQELTARDEEARDSLIESGKMYVVPSRCLDDYYWMLASVSNQTNSTERSLLSVSSDDSAGRFPGLRPLLVTNDQMRDHKMDLLEPREFRRWCSCHIVNYDITPLVRGKEQERNVTFFPADFFSREIQGNKHSGSDEGTVWHFPVSEWQKRDRLCVWIPR